MKTLKRGKEIEMPPLIVVINLPRELREKFVGKIVDCSRCGFRGELDFNEEYATHEDDKYETIYIRCTNCKSCIVVEVIKSRRVRPVA